MDDASPGQPATVLTLTVNPALDISATTPEVIADHKLRCTGSRLDPGGGGVNVARVVRRLGGRTVAVYTAGGPIGEAYQRLIEAERVPGVVVPIRGSTRASFTIDEGEDAAQYRFVLEGPELSEDEWRTCLDYVAQLAAPGGLVVASGSLAPGVPTDFYARVARVAREAGARCVVDSTGPALAEALAEGVFLVAPSRRELAAHAGGTLGDERAVAEAAMTLVASGAAQYVAVTLGSGGAILAAASGTRHLAAPAVQAVGSVGAGDSFVAGLVLRLAEGRSVEDGLIAGVAAGTAAVLSPGTELCSPAEFARLEAELRHLGA
ncbi:1-phosphofructokinase family hexose kinase [Leifsonia xyli]|uniref:1-phosphofructokinase family hexose kinase n=1 Tax=Leifsonia xyli TaxID=1575 RepID=UPI003D6645BA